jgi:hypothetical protein
VEEKDEKRCRYGRINGNGRRIRRPDKAGEESEIG